MKRLLIITLVVIVGALNADFQVPTIHPSIMLDSKFYSGDNANKGDYETTNRYQVRKVAIAIQGNIDSQVTYDIEFGNSTCVGSGTTFKLMDAEIYYHFSDNLKFGLQQGHILRGFAGVTECTSRLTMEKPIFFKTFAPCHPTGLVINNYFPLANYSGLEIEAAIMNGVNGTLDGEHDYNLGVMYYTPWEGLALTADYNHTAKNYYDDDFEQYSEEGYRGLIGFQYENNNILTTGEVIKGKGFAEDSQKMLAYYLQTGYSISTPLQNIKYIQPYVMYEFWDKHYDDNDIESEYSYWNFGLNISLNEVTKIKVAYKLPQDDPVGNEVKIESFVARLQIAY